MITRVAIKGYKSFKDVALDLGALTVVIGPNASGKSNLLDAIGLLSRMVTGGTIRSAFDEHRGNPIEAFFVPPGGLDALLSSDVLAFSLGVEVDLSDSTVTTVERIIRDMREGLPAGARARRVVERRMRYDLTIEFLTSTGMLRVRDERLVALRRDGEERKGRNPFLERVGDRLHLRMEGQAHPIYHDIGLDHTILSTPLYPPHYPHITAFKEELRHWRFYYLDPSVMRLESALREIDALGYDGRDLAGYYHGLRIRNGAQFENLARTLKRVVPAADGVRTTVTPGGLVRLDLVEANTDYSSRVISDGTLRVLGLLAMLAPGGAIHDHRLRGAGERRPPPAAADRRAPARQCRPRARQAAHRHDSLVAATGLRRARQLYARRLQRACPDRRKPERSGANQVREDRLRLDVWGAGGRPRPVGRPGTRGPGRLSANRPVP